MNKNQLDKRLVPGSLNKGIIPASLKETVNLANRFLSRSISRFLKKFDSIKRTNFCIRLTQELMQMYRLTIRWQLCLSSVASDFMNFSQPSAKIVMDGAVSSTPQEKRIAVVTGGNKGIGLEICRQLSNCRIRVILTARDEKRGLEAVENLKNSGLPDVLFHRLDVTDSCSIASLAEFIREQFGKLDILVNNAGIGGLTIDLDILKSLKPPDNEKAEDTGDIPVWLKQHVQQTYENAEECLKTNYYGTKYVTEALLPLLQSSNSGRIVNVSSPLGQLRVISDEKIKQQLSDVNALTKERLDTILKSFLKDFKEDLLEAHGWPTVASAYKVSKVLINSYTRILSKSYPNLCINCVSPGFVKTDMNWNSGILTVEDGARGPVMLALLPHSSYSGLFFEQTEVSFF